MIEHVCAYDSAKKTPLTIVAFNRLDYLDLYIDRILTFIEPFDKNLLLLYKLIYSHINSSIVLGALLKKLINCEPKDFFYELVNLNDDMHRNLLHLAFLYNVDDESIEILMKYGADKKTIEATDLAGNTLLDYAYFGKKVKFY
ncbi:MAG: hypothetical protein QXO21_03915 [Candidatus Anstonellales archaeon]